VNKPRGVSNYLPHDLRGVFIIGLALVALTLKMAIAYNTIGTNDVVVFYSFAKALSEHGLEWTYQHSRYFNHPPLTAAYLQGIYVLTEQRWCQDMGIHFPFLLRLPGIIADFLVMLVLLRMSKTDLRIPTWALALFALSPVSLMVSGFHGNTDPVMVLLLVCAAWMCLRNRPVLCGLFFAFSCQIKIVPLLLLPAFALFWLSHRKACGFFLTLAFITGVLWWQPLLMFPALFFKNVLSYGSYWGIWGITYCLRLTGIHDFSRLGFFNLEPVQQFVVTVLKIVIVGAALLIAWRRRHLPGPLFLSSLTYTWIVFFILAPGVCAQYLIWLAPFVLIRSPKLYTWLLVSSSVFLFVFYNVTARHWPWKFAFASNQLSGVVAPWSLLPWIVLITGSIALWRKTVWSQPALRLSSLETLSAEVCR
jgi:uncharacterized membrane protein